MRLKKGTNNRGLIYFFYDASGIVDRYAAYMLRKMKECVRDVYVVANGVLTEHGRNVFREFTEHVWERENKGLDVAAYKYALEKIGWEKIKEYDELILMNHTIMGPAYSLQEMFDAMGEQDLDFWGTNIFYKVGFDPYGLTDCGYIREHLQSHFIVARNSLLCSEDYRNYWEGLPPITTYEESVSYHESYFTHHFSELGYKWQAYAHWDGLEDYDVYPMFRMPVELMKRTHCPFFKRRNFIHGDYNDFLYSTNGEPSIRLLEFLKEETDYDVDMIWENILRDGNQADIQRNLGLNHIVSSRESEDMADVIRKKGVALVYHFYYEECIDNILHYISSLPEEVDLYFTAGSEQKKKVLEKALQSIKNKIEILSVENRGRDVSALLIGAGDKVSQYEYICFAHDKRVTQLKPLSQGEGWSYKCFESILKNRHAVNNIISLFEENPRLGMLSPAPPNHAGYYSLMGAEWTDNFENTKALAKELGVKVPMSPEKEPITPIGTIFWFRSKALKKLFDRNWKYSDFPEEPSPNDGTVSHAIERLYSFVVQDAGFYPAWAFCDEGAAIELTNIGHMLRGFNRMLFANEIRREYYSDTKKLLGNTLAEETVFSSLTPALYIDSGHGFHEEEVLRISDVGRTGPLRAVFRWKKEEAPLHIRFDPCETGGISMKKTRIYLLLDGGRKKKISLKKCACNGHFTGKSIVFENPDPWIDIPLEPEIPSVGVEIYADVAAV